MKHFLSLTGLSMSLLLLACSSSKSNAIPTVAPITSPLFQPTVVWSANIGNGSGKAYNPMNPMLVGNTLYADSSDGTLVAFKAASGQVVWQTKYQGGLTGDVGADTNRVVVGTNSGSLIALNAKDGTSLWTLPLGNLLQGGPLVTSSVIVVKKLDNTATAFDPNTQKTLWQYQRSLSDLSLKGGSAPIYADGRVILGFDDGSVAALQANSGDLAWEQSIANNIGLNPIQRMVSVNANLLASNGVVYAAAYQGNIAAIDVSSGNLLWERPISSYAGFALTGNTLIVSTSVGNLVALNTKTGNTLWRQTDLSGRKLTAPVIVGRNVVVADNAGDVHWLNTSNGQFVSRLNLGKTPIYADPVARGQDVWIYNATGELVDLRTPNA